jgi:hypothetical protein
MAVWTDGHHEVTRHIFESFLLQTDQKPCRLQDKTARAEDNDTEKHLWSNVQEQIKQL